ncbi:MAG: adenosylcobinamide amidohydrolase [Bacillota bacterium]
MILYRLANGDALERRDNAVIARFSGCRRVLSTAPHNGGYRDTLKWVFNHCCNQPGQEIPAMKAPTYARHTALVAEELGLDPEYAAGISTIASMENAAIESLSYRELWVTAVVTAGVDDNAARPGDPAPLHETEEGFAAVHGTINTLLFIGAALSEGALAQALALSAEAKAAALQEVCAPSCYSDGLATGTGTDGTIIAANAEGFRLTWAGHHCKLGELIGKTVKTAVKKALFLQTGLDADRQFDALRRMGRFGVTEDALYAGLGPGRMSQEEFRARLNTLSRQGEIAVTASLYAHVLDQLRWGLFSPKDAEAAADRLLRQIGAPPEIAARGLPAAETAQALAAAFSRALLERILRERIR